MMGFRSFRRGKLAGIRQFQAGLEIPYLRNTTVLLNPPFPSLYFPVLLLYFPEISPILRYWWWLGASYYDKILFVLVKCQPQGS